MQHRRRAVGQRLLQQLLPAGQQQGAVIQLDVEQVAGRKAAMRLQVVADLLRAGAEIVATVAEQGQRIAVDGAIVGCPQATVDGIFNTWILRGRGPALPTAAGRGPVRRQ